jgi:cobalamin biosynthesis protein CobD/CbiB
LKFLSLLAALLLEQMRPLRADNPIYAAFERYSTMLERQLNAGQQHHGVVAWLLAVVPIVAVTVIIYHVLYAVSPVLGWIWNIGVLYVTMGFRQFSHYFTEIIHALRQNDIATARVILGRWRGESADEFSAGEAARVAIELALIGSHRHVFGPIAAFLVLGPAGPMIYRTSAILAEKWGRSRDPEFGDFGLFAQKFFFWFDWLPARLSAASFAAVGNFEDAIYCWRTQARAWARGAHGLILASGGGAIGVRLGDPLHETGGNVQFRPELGTGEDADVDYMQSAVGLIWRALVLWMFIVLLITIVHSLG